MQKIIQIIEGRTMTCLTEDGEVYHWFTFYEKDGEKVFSVTDEEKESWEKKREWVILEKCHELNFHSEAKKLEVVDDEKDQTAEDVLQDGQEEDAK